MTVCMYRDIHTLKPYIIYQAVQLPTFIYFTDISIATFAYPSSSTTRNNCCKYKAVHIHNMKASGNGDSTPFIVKPGTRCNWIVSFAPWPLHKGKTALVIHLIEGRRSGPQVFEEEVIKSHSLPGFKPQLLNHRSSKGLTKVRNLSGGFHLCAVDAQFERNSVFSGLKKEERR